MNFYDQEVFRANQSEAELSAFSRGSKAASKASKILDEDMIEIQKTKIEVEKGEERVVDTDGYNFTESFSDLLHHSFHEDSP